MLHCFADMQARALEAVSWRMDAAIKPVARAFVLSVLVHVLLVSTLEVGNRLDLWRFSPLAVLGQWLHLDLSPAAVVQKDLAERRALELEEAVREREIPVVFVDVDPAQATEEAPPKTPFYGAVNSLAGNRDTAQDLPDPALEGEQDKVLKTMDTERARPNVVPLQPAPVVPQQPQKGAEAEPVAPQPVVAEARPVEAPTPVPPVPERLARVGPPAAVPAEARQPAGETLVAKNVPDAERVTEAAGSVETPPAAAPPERVRPRTVAAALAQKQINPNSALVGQKMRQEGGVRRFSVSSSLNVAANPLGNYDQRFVAAVQQCWYALLEEQRYSLDRVGKVMLEFGLTYDGRIVDMAVRESDVGDLFTEICKLAVTKPAPYEKWPLDVRKLVGGDVRTVRFTFYY